jgi:hypothetical protein
MKSAPAVQATVYALAPPSGHFVATAATARSSVAVLLQQLPMNHACGALQATKHLLTCAITSGKVHHC